MYNEINLYDREKIKYCLDCIHKKSYGLISAECQILECKETKEEK